jgi:hypothetical protein
MSSVKNGLSIVLICNKSEMFKPQLYESHWILRRMKCCLMLIEGTPAIKLLVFLKEIIAIKKRYGFSETSK